MSEPMMVSDVGLTARGSSSSSMPAPARVTQATSGAKPSMCSASFMRNERGMSRGNAQFSWPLSLIMSSKARWIASHIAHPYGRTTIMPRTPDQSASPALRTTSVYHRSKSSDILVMSFTKSCCSSTVSLISVAHKLIGLDRDCGQSPPARRFARRHLPTSGEARLERERGRAGRALGRDRVDLGQEHGEQFLLGHGLVQLTALEDDPFAPPAGDADAGAEGVAPAAVGAPDVGDRVRGVEPRDVPLHRPHGGRQ